ncbi:MAG: peptidoglycan editing factor PgeF [Gammaproteobacteria bacterium]
MTLNAPVFEWIEPRWPAPANVRAVSTTRCGGVSRPPFDSLNLADHVGDRPADVEANRRILRRRLGLPSPPCWLRQVHGSRVVRAEGNAGCEADGAYSDTPGVVCAVMTADCLPLLLCDRRGSRVAALHAGWRGLAGGIVEAGVEAMGYAGEDLLAWLGPAIGPDHFEVGEEVRAQFVAHQAEAAGAFRPSANGRWLADLYELARQRLRACGVSEISGGGFCTYRERGRFFSFRRDSKTGRSATLVWLEAAAEQ